MNNKKLWFLIGGVLCAALIVWVVLIVNIFGRDTESTDSPKKGKTKEKEQISSDEQAPDGEQDEQNLLVFRMTKWYTTEDGKKELGASFEYDEKGNRIKQITGNLSGGEDYTEYVYDDSGRMIRWTNYDTAFDTVYTTEFEYDSKGRETRYTMVKSFGGGVDFTYERKTVYDDESRKSFATTHITPGKGSTEFAETEYDENGWEISHTIYDGTKRLAIEWFEYDDNGKKVKEYMLQNPETSDADYDYMYVYEYEIIGDRLWVPVKKSGWTYGGNLFRTIIYEYDAYGNLIRETESSEGEVISEKEYQYERFLIPAACATDMDKEQLLIEKSAKE